MLKGRWTVWAVALFFAILAGVGVLLIVGKAADRVPYYVTAVDLPERTLLTPDVVKQVDANADAVPPTALTLGDIQSGTYFTKLGLAQGEVLTRSVAGPYVTINYDIPENYVTASLSVPPERAAAGQIKAGDYVDIAVAEGTGQAGRSKVVLQHVLVLDVTTDPSSIAQAATEDSKTTDEQPGPDSPVVRGGIPKLYTFAVSPESFAKLALVASSNPYLALSAEKTQEELDASATGQELFAPGGVKDEGAGTEASEVTSSPVPVPTSPATPTPTSSPTSAPTSAPATSSPTPTSTTP